MSTLASDAETGAPAAPPAAAVRPGDVLVLEAATAELALHEVAAKLGDQVEILAAERVRRGGVGGFFAKELCRLTVRVPGTTPEPAVNEADARAVRDAVGAPAPPGPVEPPGLDAMLRRMAEQTTVEEDGFAAMLRARMGIDAERVSAAAAGATNAARAARAAQASLLEPEPRLAPAPRLAWTRDPQALDGTGPVRWSAGALERLGLPPALISATEAQEPVDDAGWLVALAAAVAPSCRPLPAGDAVLTGPRAAALGQALGLPVTKRPDAPAADGTVCLPSRDTLPAREWLAGVRGGRWLHLVVGGTGWHGLLFDEPLAVSWVGADQLPAALHQCAAFGLVLGYGIDGPGGELLRANPIDVALSVRSLLPRR